MTTQTLIALVTGIAGIISAVTALIVALKAHGTATAVKNQVNGKP